MSGGTPLLDPPPRFAGGGGPPFRSARYGEFLPPPAKPIGPQRGGSGSGVDLLALASRVGAALAIAAFVGLGILFAVQSLPAWQATTTGFPFTTTWHARGGLFGALPMIYGSVVVAAVALTLALPLALGSALWMSELLPRRARLVAKMAVELLAGVPSIVYGLLGVLLLREPIARLLAPFEPASGDTLLTAGLLLAVMILPTLATLADDAFSAVSAEQRAAARALGLTRAETIWRVVLPQASAGVTAAVLLGLGRALGETVAVYLVVGRRDNRPPSWPADLFSLRPLADAGQTITSKLGGAEPFLAAGDPVHTGAIAGLAVLLLVLVLIPSGLGAAIVRRARIPGRSVNRESLGAVREPPLRLADSSPGPGPAEPSPMDLLRIATPQKNPGTADVLVGGMPARTSIDRVLRFALTLAGALAVTFPLALFALLYRRAHAVLDSDFLTHFAAQAGAAGGVLGETVGTLVLISTSLFVALPLALGLALTRAAYLRTTTARRTLDALLSAAAAIPSIVWGLAGLAVFGRFLGWGKSWLAGGIVLGLMIVPTIAVALVERLLAVAPRVVQAARALGLSNSQTVRSVLLPQARAGLVSGSLLGIARAAGETAPILLTAAVFSGAELWPRGIVESPVAALPYHVFVLAQDSLDPRAQEHLWGAAFVLLAIVLTLSLAALPLRLRLFEASRKP